MRSQLIDPSGLVPVERDACAIICFVNKAARPTHGNVQRTIDALIKMGHRAGEIDGERLRDRGVAARPVGAQQHHQSLHVVRRRILQVVRCQPVLDKAHVVRVGLISAVRVLVNV